MRYIVIIFLLLPNLVLAATETHYVCSSGNGAGLTDGSSEANCFDGFSDIVWDGETEDADDNEVGPNDDLILCTDGTYREELSVGASGLSGKPITIKDQDGETPIINGSTIVSTWAEESTNKWYATWTSSTAQQLLFDGTRGTEETGTCPDDLNTDKEWCLDDPDDKLYVYSTEDPDTRWTTVENSNRNALYIEDKNYITVDGITIKNSGWDNITFKGTCNTIIVENCTISYAWRAGIHSLDDGIEVRQNITIQDNSDSYSGGAGIALSDYTQTAMIQRNTVDEAGMIHGTDGFHDFSAAIHVGLENTNNIIVQYNKTTNGGNGEWDEGLGIWFDTVQSGSGSVIRWNTVSDSVMEGIRLEKCNQVAVYGNLSYGNSEGIRVHSSNNGVSCNSNKIYNNTFYGNGIGIFIRGVTGGNNLQNNEFKNNISWGNTTRELRAIYGGENDGTLGSGNIYTYNSFGAEASNFIEWALGSYYSTYDTWQAASGCGVGICDNQIESDCAMTNPGSDIFTLPAQSACIDSGVDVGDYDCLDMRSTFPSSVITKNQELYHKFDLGAYCFSMMQGPGMGLMQ